MVTNIGTISVNVKNDALDAINRMAAHFETAPNDDPAKMAMAAFGEIDAEKHLIIEGGKEGGEYFVRTTLSPELQAICDMVP
ncbi:MAG: hypothetical protein II336_18110 [Loktanella sp.]|nr:hypothetical protein [Loktanella sp.]